MIRIFSQPDFPTHLWFDSQKSTIEKQVQQILNQVAKEKDSALFRLTQEQSGIKINSLRVSTEEMKIAREKLSSSELYALKIAKENITSYHQKTKPQDWFEEDDEKTWGQKFTAIEKVGIYIPGGKTAYPSSVLMNVIPAQIAKVKNIQVLSPPQENGLPHHSILAVLDFLEIENVFASGGAQAIAALAYGTESIEKVHLVTGPGNQFVAEAKKQLFGKIGIDSIAGPSEIAILLDEEDNTPLEWIAQDFISQAEHGLDSKAILVTPSTTKAEEIKKIAEKLVSQSLQKESLEKNLSHYAFIVTTQNLSEAIKIINQLAPEHLQIFSAKKSILTEIQNAGAIFWGAYSPVAMGDYVAGSNHTLPTAATAQFSSGLSVASFMKSSSYLEYKEKGFKKNAIPAITLAEIEKMTEHSNSIKQRLD